jgi:hypothetical protein
MRAASDPFSMHAVKGRLEPGVSARALMDQNIIPQMRRLSLSFDVTLSPGIHLETGQAPDLREPPLLMLVRTELGDCSTHMIRPSVTSARASSEFSKGIPDRGSVRTGNLHVYIHPELETSSPFRSTQAGLLPPSCSPPNLNPPTTSPFARSPRTRLARLSSQLTQSSSEERTYSVAFLKPPTRGTLKHHL